MENEIKVGSIVVCIDSEHRNLTMGKIYTVVGIEDPEDGDNALIHVIADNGEEDSFFRKRFVLCDIQKLGMDEQIRIAKTLLNKKCVYDGGYVTTPTSIRVVVDERFIVGLSGRAIKSFEEHGFVVTLETHSVILPMYEFSLAQEFSEVRLTSDYNAKVYKDKVIVGCQTIPISKLQELLDISKGL